MNLKQLYQRYEVMIHNFSYMTLLKAITIVLPLVTFPYLIKVLGAEKYGLVMWAWAIAQIMIVVVKFGYDTLGVRLIAENINNKQEINRIVSQISFVKLFLFAVVTLFIFILLQFDKFSEHSVLFYIFIFFIFFESMFPVWYFQGIEKMKYIAILVSLTKLLFALSVFIFVNNPNDYLLVPLLYTIGSAISLISSLFIISKDKITLMKIDLLEAILISKESFLIFFATIGTVLRDKVTIILLEVYLGLESVAYFDLASKVINVLLTPFHILSSVTYPYIAKTKELKLLFKVVIASLLISIMLVGIFLVNVEYISLVLVGTHNQSMVNILKLIIFIVPVGMLSAFISTNILVVFNFTVWLMYSVVVAIIGYILLFLLMQFYDLLSITIFVGLYLSFFILQLFGLLIGMIKILNTRRKFAY